VTVQPAANQLTAGEIFGVFLVCALVVVGSGLITVTLAPAVRRLRGVGLFSCSVAFLGALIAVGYFVSSGRRLTAKGDTSDSDKPHHWRRGMGGRRGLAADLPRYFSGGR
jgi:hypothetical protein